MAKTDTPDATPAETQDEVSKILNGEQGTLPVDPQAPPPPPLPEDERKKDAQKKADEIAKDVTPPPPPEPPKPPAPKPKKGETVKLRTPCGRYEVDMKADMVAECLKQKFTRV